MKSLLKRVEVDEALAAHTCRGNPNHEISRGERRLKVRPERGWEHYCVLCGVRIIEENIAELQRLQEILRESRTGVIRL